MGFVLGELPGILARYSEEDAAEALEELARTFRERRTEVMKDRRPEIEANRSAVDARLAEREAEQDAKREDAEAELRTQAAERAPAKKPNRDK
jgi:hypothetical protein